MLKKWTLSGCAALSLLIFASSLLALSPTEGEQSERARWADAKFDLVAPTDEGPILGIFVHANNDPVQIDQRNGRPMKLGDRKIERGLYCHATSNLEVLLDRPAKKLTALIGVDHNENTAGGGGSVVFSIRVDNQEIFKSELMHGGEPGVPISVDLGGAKTFSLLVSDGGDGISCDQADWAEAVLEYADGTTQPLSALPIIQDTGERTFEAAYPFSFIYDGKSSREFLESWQKSSEVKIDGDKKFRTLTFDAPDGKLQVRCEAIEYLDFPTVEWKLFFKNKGGSDTAIIENILPLDTTFTRDFFVPAGISYWDPEFGTVQRNNRQNEFLLHHFVGAPTRIDDYLPLETPLPTGAAREFLSGGRPLNTDSPYFNVQAAGHGWLVVVGWPGQWKARFARDGGRSLDVTAGQGTTHFKLLPGEEVRSPLAVVQNWRRESWLDAQNVWRAWMVKYNVPRLPDGSFVDHHIGACSSHFFSEMTKADTASQKLFIDRYLEEKIPLDYWWMDAGWYPCEGNWPKTGTWEVDETRFPGGFRPITDHGRSKGVKSIVWFEPERVAPDTWLTNTHPEWILGGKNGGLLNLGNREAREWLIDHIDGMIKKEGIDLYRQDFNMDPLASWQSGDTPDRQGITEIGHVTGYLAYWDALLSRNPGLRIDSCASGGNRNDLETLRRAVPLLRSDYILEAVGNQNHTFGISLWIPYHGTGARAFDDYGLRSTMVPYFNLCYDLRDKTNDYDNLRKNLKIWSEILCPLYGADYYPITTTPDRESQTQPLEYLQSIWCGWQLNDPAQGRGAIQLFRRIDSLYSEGTFPLRGLDPNAAYEFTDVDTGVTTEYAGRDLMEKGLPVRIDTAPKAVILSYKLKSEN